VLEPPQDVTAALGAEAWMIADIDVAEGQMPSFQWRKNGVPIYDDGRIEGTETEHLVFNTVTADDVGSYDCIITRGCASVTSEPALLTVCRCLACPADFNEDGGVDGSDIEAFFTAWEAGDACGDTNLDGGVDGGDIEAFFVVWEAGGC